MSLGALAISLSTTASGQTAAAGTPTAAADTGGAADGEILVTARKREETLLSVPVTVTAVTGAQLAARGITNLEGVARTVPSLMIANSSGSVQGAAVGLRGISAGEGVNTADQAVGFYMDNVLVARSTPRRFAAYDLEQIEILKGPQPLYYGKNSPGGIIIMRSADPTKHFEAKAQVGYEFNAHEVVGEGYISGPLTDSLGVRIAAFGSTMRGWVHNDATVTGTALDPKDRNGPKEDFYSGRITLKYDNGGPFTARLKYSYGKDKMNGIYANTQLVDCPAGAPQAGSPTDACRPDDRNVRAELSPNFGTFYKELAGGIRTYTDQHLGGLDLAYKLSDNLTLTSTTGFYKVHAEYLDNVTVSDSSKPTAQVTAYTGLRIREISEEVRLTSSFDGPFNFMIGGYYQNQKLSQPLVSMANANAPFLLQGPAEARGKNDAYSAFASINYKPIETLEISGGARYTKEIKRFDFYRMYPGVATNGVPYKAGDVVPNSRPERSFSNVSPEVTLTWRPTQTVTVYGGWKRGFLSGGFNPAPTALNSGLPISDRSFDDENVSGFEAGVKAELLDRALRINLAGFTYKIKNLQVASNIAATSQSFIGNAASAKTEGFEFDATYRTPIEGLSLNGGLAYDKAYYLSYNTAACYGGQSIAQGCNLNLNLAGTAYTNQDLAGKPLVRSPRWGGSMGANLIRKVAGGNTLGLTINGIYTSSFETQALESLGSKQASYWLLDASARVELTNGIEFALIGRNLTNTYYVQRTADNPLTGRGAGRLDGNSLRSDTAGVVSRGREIMVRVSMLFK